MEEGWLFGVGESTFSAWIEKCILNKLDIGKVANTEELVEPTAKTALLEFCCWVGTFAMCLQCF